MDLSKPYHGINTPLFSLKTEKSSGIGEFLDLLPLIDWCETIGFSIIQLLPLNDSALDPSPYNAVSAFALHPIYVSLHALPFVTDKDLEPFQPLNHLSKIDYPKVLSLKLAFFKEYFNRHFSSIQSDPSYKTFIANHKWLKSYVDFKGEEFHALIQYFAFQQLKSVKLYANQKGIFLKGDIPILISPDSLDVKLYPADFNLDLRAGAPPDMFTPDGQYWGFPTYHWDAIEKEGFTWWKERLSVASEFYDIFRIDHIIGFYRIFAIPVGQKAIQGAFIPSDQNAAITQGEHLLKTILSFTPMYPIGEDLGLFIDHIRKSLSHLGIPGTKIPRWERYYDGDKSFIPYNNYLPCSLTTLSTHDTELLSEWWTLFPSDAKEFARCFNLPSELTPTTRIQILHDAHHSASLFHINLLQEYLALEETFVSKDPHLDRINVPGTLLPTNWCHRYLPTLSQITSHPKLTALMKSLI